MQIMVLLDKTLYEGLSRLSILTGTLVYLQMSDDGQIQQQDTICRWVMMDRYSSRTQSADE